MIRSILASVLFLSTVAFAGVVPRPAPAFVVNLTPSGQITPQQYRGKVVILNFIITTCPHCQQVTQFLNGLQKEYAVRGLQILSVAFTDNDMAKTQVPGFIKQYQPPYPVGYTTRTDVLNFLGRPANEEMYVPVSVFIDRKGIIRAEYMGDNPFFQNYQKNIRAQVEELLKPPAPATKVKPNPKKKVS